MAKKKQESKSQLLLKKNIQEGNVIIGKDRVLKALKGGEKLSSVLLATNCPADVKADIEHYGKLVGVDVTVAEQDNEELGILCKKAFFVAVLGIKGE